MANNKKPQVAAGRIGQEKKSLSAEEIKRLLLLKTDEQAASKGTDEILDRVNERAGLINDEQGVIVSNGVPNGYEPRYTTRFYAPIFRLLGLTPSDEKFSKKPMIIAKVTIYLIYLRFPAGTLKKLWAFNPKVNGKRLYKHFQFFTALGDVSWEQFMEDAIELMNQCTHWDQFVRRFAQKHGKPWQAHLFDKD